MQDCRQELHSLLTEDVRNMTFFCQKFGLFYGLFQRLAGASLLVFANKQDLQGSMSDAEICDVRSIFSVPIFSI